MSMREGRAHPGAHLSWAVGTSGPQAAPVSLAGLPLTCGSLPGSLGPTLALEPCGGGGET